MKLAARTDVCDTACPGRLFPGLQCLPAGQLLRQRAPTQEACLQVKFLVGSFNQNSLFVFLFFQTETMENVIVFSRALIKNL